MPTISHFSRRATLILMTLILLGSAFLRFYGLGAMAELLHGDEAYYGLDALSLVENPRLQVYFPANTGREGLWMWLLAPMVAGLGATPFALRVTSALVGILTIAACYRLGRESLGQQAGIWTACAMAVLYWHVQLSHIGLRVITLPLMGALAFAVLFRAHRLGRGWWLAGTLVGITFYTYTASIMYVGYAGLWMLWWAWHNPKQRRGIAFALLMIGVVVAPLLVSRLLLTDATPSVLRAAASDAQAIGQNLVNWAWAWTGRGDVSSTHNLPNRPVLDIPLVVLAIAGFVGAWQLIKQKWMLIWWAGLVAVALVPTVLSVETPHFLRGAGLLLPCVMLLGVGATWLTHWRYGRWLVVSLLVIAGTHTLIDFDTWLNTESDDFGITYDYRVNEGLYLLDTLVDSDLQIMMPGVVFHPTAAFISAGLNRDIIFYDWLSDEDCYLSPITEYAVLDLPIELNNFPNRVPPFVETLNTLVEDPELDYRIHTITPPQAITSGWESAPTFGEAISVQLIPPERATFASGEPIAFQLAMQINTALPRDDYRVLVHLQSDPTPYEGGTLYATGDTALCSLAYQASARDSDLVALQPLSLTLPDDLPAGEYHVAIGFYTPDTFERLPLMPTENAHDYHRAWEFSVSE
ncbi:MAG: glycosyltransferase family 39 protein [Chloroflexota bacterium]